MADPITIKDEDLTILRDDIVVITGGSSGIGLATTRLLLKLHAKVVIGDINPPPDDVLSQVVYVKVDVTSWADQKALFNAAIAAHGRVDHAFANAGISPFITFMEDELDGDGELQPPNLKVLQVNLIGEIYTVKLAIHHIRKNQRGGSIVLTGSASSFQQMMTPDYTCAKTGVLGLMRGLMHLLNTAELPIRINMLGPQWVRTGLVPSAAWDIIGDAVQSSDFVASQVALLMADKERHGHFLFSDMYVAKEIEGPMRDLAESFLEKNKPGWVGLNEALIRLHSKAMVPQSIE